MKIMLFRLSSLLVLMLIAAVGVFAQQDTVIQVPPPIGPDAGLQDFMNLYGYLESAVIIVAGYLHNFIPGLNLIKAKWLRIVLIGAVTAVIFFALGLNDGLGVALAFFQAIGLYEILFKRLLASSPTKAETAPSKPRA